MAGLLVFVGRELPQYFENLQQGLAEGIPGPRGPAGEMGADGARGPGIVDAVAATLVLSAQQVARTDPAVWEVAATGFRDTSRVAASAAWSRSSP